MRRKGTADNVVIVARRSSVYVRMHIHMRAPLFHVLIQRLFAALFSLLFLPFDCFSVHSSSYCSLSPSIRESIESTLDRLAGSHRGPHNRNLPNPLLPPPQQSSDGRTAATDAMARLREILQQQQHVMEWDDDEEEEEEEEEGDDEFDRDDDDEQHAVGSEREEEENESVE